MAVVLRPRYEDVCAEHPPGSIVQCRFMKVLQSQSSLHRVIGVPLLNEIQSICTAARVPVLFCARRDFIRFDPCFIRVNPRLDFPALPLQPATPTIASASRSPLDNPRSRPFGSYHSSNV